MPPRIAITGASGFIGTNMARFYIDKGIDIINLDIAPPVDSSQQKWWRKTDVLNFTELENAISDFAPTHLIHLAARTDLNETKNISQYAVNIEGVKNVIEVLNVYGKITRVIFTSSMLVCERGYLHRDANAYKPSTLYGKSKMLGEKLVKGSNENSFEWVIVRPASIWGPWFGEPYRNFFDIVIEGKYVHPGKRSCSKTFGYVKNVVYQMNELLFSGRGEVNQGTFYLGDYTPVNISEWADEIAEVLGQKSFKHVPFIAFKVAARAGDILKRMGFKTFPMTSFRLKNMTEDNIVDVSGIREIAPSLPYSMEAGIKETLEWLGKLK